MITFDANGLQFTTFEQVVEEIADDFRAAFGSNILTGVSSTFGQLIRIMAMRESKLYELIAAVVESLDPRLAEGAAQDARYSLLGITREAARPALVTGTASGTPATAIANGVRLSVGGYTFAVVDGPYVIGGGGTVEIHLEAAEDGPVDVSILGAWSILDTVSGFDAFDDTEQTDAGRLLETNAEFRERAEVERYRRGQGPLVAIEAAVSAIEAVEYVAAYHNVTVDPVDADGVPLHAIHVVVVGGDPAEIAAAIVASGPAGHLFYGVDESVEVTTGSDTQVVGFDRVTSIPIYVRATLTTSTATDESAPDDLEDLTVAALVAYATARLQIGVDVLAHRFAGAISSTAGVDDILVETSLDGVTWSTDKIEISNTEQAVLTAARVTFVED